MCEFRVTARTGSKEKSVANDIISAKIDKQELVLRDVLGSTQRLKDTIIGEVDVGREAMNLIEIPIISQILSFIGLYDLCQTEKRYHKVIESEWEEVKDRGNKLIRSLRRKYGSTQKESGRKKIHR